MNYPSGQSFVSRQKRMIKGVPFVGAFFLFIFLSFFQFFHIHESPNLWEIKKNLRIISRNLQRTEEEVSFVLVFNTTNHLTASLIFLCTYTALPLIDIFILR